MNLPSASANPIPLKESVELGAIITTQMSSEQLSLVSHQVLKGVNAFQFSVDQREKSVSSGIELKPSISNQSAPVTHKESHTGAKDGPDEKPQGVGYKLAVILVYQLLIFLFFFGCGYGCFSRSRHPLQFMPNALVVAPATLEPEITRDVVAG
jgi:hypothetical protein